MTIRVRTDRSYFTPFIVNLGQRNATITNRYLMPIRKFLPYAGALAIVGPGYDLVHSINAVPVLTRVPYIITFEDFMPRTPTDIRIAILENWLRARIAQDQCVALIAMSHYAVRQLQQQNAGAVELPAILAKTEVIHPAVPVRAARPKAIGNKLRLLFVGKDFMRKGLPAVVRAHEILLRWGIPVETTAVSTLRWSHRDYVGPPNRRIVDVERARLRASGINIQAGLPNPGVVNLMRHSDFLVLPTFHETFGYVSLEALSVGTPVVATDTCALREVVDHQLNGLLLPFRNDREVGKWIWIYRTSDPAYTTSYLDETERLGAELANQLANVWERRADYENMSEGALQTVKRRFAPQSACERLEQLYEFCLQRARAATAC